MKRSRRTPIVEKKMRPGELLERGEGIATGPPAGVDLGKPTESGPAMPVPPPRPPPATKLNREHVLQAMKLRGELDRVTDEMNAKIVEVEQQIAALRIGVTGEVPIMVDGDRTDSLGWYKLNDAWRLCYVIDVKGQPLDRRPLVQATRAHRMSAIPFFIALVNALADNAERELERVERAREQVQAFTAEVVAASKAGP